MKGTSRQALCAALQGRATESEEGTLHHPQHEQSTKKEEAAGPLYLCTQRGGTTARKEDTALFERSLKREGAAYPLHPLRGGITVHEECTLLHSLREQSAKKEGAAHPLHTQCGGTTARKEGTFLGVHIGRSADGLQNLKSSLLFLKSTPRVEEEELTIFPGRPKPH